MKSFLFWCFLTLPLIAFGQFNVMTYNIRLGSVDDGPNHWNIRKDKVLALMDYYDCGIFGLQEAQLFQLDYLLKGLKGHVFIGKPRNNDVNAEYSCIVYDTTLFTASHVSTIWLSPTPDTISVGWDAALPRIATYAHFQHKQSNDQFWVINTHLDHKGEVARYESAKMLTSLAQKLFQTKPFPVILMGDFNARPEENTIQQIKNTFLDTRAYSVTEAYGGPDTWNAFAFDKKPDGTIDYLFLFDTRARMRIYKHRTIMDHYDQKYPSDHFPVMIQAGFFTPTTRKGSLW